MKKYTYEINHDDFAMSPRDWFNVATMVCLHKRYQLGDTHGYRSSDFTDWDEVKQQIERDHDVVAIEPLYLYDHGVQSIAMRSFIGRAHHAEWDSGQIGYIFITRDNLREHLGWQRLSYKRKPRLLEIMQSETDAYDKWLRSETYWIEINEGEDTVDTLSGIVGYENAKKQAEEIIAELETGIVEGAI